MEDKVAVYHIYISPINDILKFSFNENDCAAISF